jgi:hypothetical protein
LKIVGRSRREECRWRPLQLGVTWGTYRRKVIALISDFNWENYLVLGGAEGLVNEVTGTAVTLGNSSAKSDQARKLDCSIGLVNTDNRLALPAD